MSSYPLSNSVCPWRENYESTPRLQLVTLKLMYHVIVCPLPDRRSMREKHDPVMLRKESDVSQKVPLAEKGHNVGESLKSKGQNRKV